ncbi:MAG TPA: Fic family protein [Elusimicrobia bacterium]|nr:Fic family protein [Elusimicrobiota bacterium]HBT62596.1 Fic family protein [Elusimicrobiota bacterium]
MTPAIPSRTTPELDELIVNVLASSAALGKGIHPLVAAEIARLMVKVNSYYTNAMEGNPSKLKDIEAALNKKFSKDETRRNFQLEHVAHIQVQEAMVRRLREEASLRICSADFLCWLHAEFFLKLPPELRFAKTESGKLVPVEPGRLRDRGITVGRHQGPEKETEIRSYLAKFDELLSPEKLAGPQKLIGMAAAHHRFLWIHPFAEGNGRVARLLTTAYGIKINVGDNMLWTVARAFARRRPDYDRNLAQADLPRRNDLDGRGPLSEEGLLEFCTFFLRCCADQIQFMDRMLELKELTRRYKRFIDGLVAEKEVSKAGAKIMEQLLLQGEVPRGQALQICHVKQRRATQIVKELLDSQITRSETAYGPLRLNISADMAAVLFPELA